MVGTVVKELLVKLGIDFDNKGANQASNQVTKLAGQFRNLGQALVASAIVAGVRQMVHSTIDAAVQVDSLSKRLGIASGDLQELQFVAQASTVNIDTFNMSLQGFIRRAAEAAHGTGEATDAFAELKINPKQLRDPMRLLLATANAMAKVKGQANKLRLAQRLFGRGGLEMLDILEKQSGGINALRQRFKELGGGISKDFIEQANRAKLAGLEWDVSLAAFKRAIVVNLLPNLEIAGRKLLAFVRANPQMLTALGKALAIVIDFATGVVDGFIKMTIYFDDMPKWSQRITRLGLAVGVLVVAFKKLGWQVTVVMILLDEFSKFSAGAPSLIGDIGEAITKLVGNFKPFQYIIGMLRLVVAEILSIPLHIISVLRFADSLVNGAKWADALAQFLGDNKAIVEGNLAYAREAVDPNTYGMENAPGRKQKPFAFPRLEEQQPLAAGQNNSSPVSLTAADRSLHSVFNITVNGAGMNPEQVGKQVAKTVNEHLGRKLSQAQESLLWGGAK